MPRFFLHLRDEGSELLDEDGVTCRDMDVLHKAVLENARDTLAHGVKDAGVLDLRYRIDAEDDAGSLVYSLPFRQAVEVLS